jgi:hypothetical protein
VHRLRSAAVCLALVALVLRALVPVGWMPAAAEEGHAAIMPCPMADGMAQMRAPQPRLPSKHDPAARHDGFFCRVAASVHFAPSQAPASLQALRGDFEPAQFAFLKTQIPVLRHDWVHAPRAPPPPAI